MAVATANQVRVTRWRGGQHPTLDNITRQMRTEGLRPYVWTNTPNFRYPVRSHGYDKTLYCVQGSLELVFSKTRQRVTLRSGDRVDVPRGVRYGTIIGPTGAQCVEGSQL
ncbi:MAG: cupin [Chloroflexi bacterium]|nr:cupin [Chloroflexota bacterium]